MGYVREAEMSKKVKLREGDWFVVPIDGPRWVLGLIARRKGHGLFGYFFAPAWDHIPSLDEIGSPNARGSFTQLIFSDLELLDGGWPLIGHDEAFSRDRWPMVEFERYVESAGQRGRLYTVRYDEDELVRQVSQVEVSLKERGRRPEDGAHGAGAAENVLQFKVDSLEGRLETESPEDPAEATGEGGGSEPRGTLRHYLYVSDEGKAEALAAAVRKLGHSTEVREPAGPGFGWLVLVTDRDPFSPEVQDRREREFMELVSRYEGEYDGSEIAV
jgi:hypothetical protein